MAEFILDGPAEWRDATVAVAGGGTAETSWAAVRLADGTSIAIGQDVADRMRAEATLPRRTPRLIPNPVESRENCSGCAPPNEEATWRRSLLNI